MFFVLSKTLNYLTMPFVVVCLCFLVSVLLKNKRWKQRVFWTGFALLFFFSNDFIANEVMRLWEPEPVAYKDIPKKYKYGIVLTGVTISQRQPDDRIYFTRGADRVVHTLQLYKLGIIEKILVSGGSGRLLDIGEREADEVKTALVLMGAREEDVIVEATSRNTHESAVEVKGMFDSLNVRPSECMLITSGYHMRRSIACFRKVGLDMDTFSTDYYTHARVFTPDVFIVPRVEAFFIWHRVTKEWVGFVAYKVAGYI